jgi:hypothetical protein
MAYSLRASASRLRPSTRLNQSVSACSKDAVESELAIINAADSGLTRAEAVCHSNCRTPLTSAGS